MIYATNPECDFRLVSRSNRAGAKRTSGGMRVLVRRRCGYWESLSIYHTKLPIAKGATSESHVEEHNSRCLANTGVVLQRQIKEWAKNGNGEPIFWLNGMAGTGKSTIARTVARSFAEEGQLGASFFFQEERGWQANSLPLSPQI